MRPVILVTGATGRQGGAVAKRLLHHGFSVRAMTRHPETPAARALEHLGATVAQGDFEDAASLSRALKGADGVFAMQTPYEAGTEREIVHGVRLAEAARQSGVAQIVYSSVAGAQQATGVAHYESKGKIERHITALGFPCCTILRPVFFMEMLLSPGNLRAMARGKIELSINQSTKIAMVAVDDIARMAAAVFAEPQRWHGHAITLAGDEPNFLAVATAFGNALGHTISYVQVAPEAVEPDCRPKLATQNWLEAQGWQLDLTKLRASYPFIPRTIMQWAREPAVLTLCRTSIDSGGRDGKEQGG